MNKAVVLGIFLASISSSAHAVTEFDCTGTLEVNNSRPKKSAVSLKFKNLEEVSVLDASGEKYELDYYRQNSRYKFYGDHEYDSYGGSVDLRVLRSLDLTGPDATQQFRTKFAIERYTEEGLESTEIFLGDCVRN